MSRAHDPIAEAKLAGVDLSLIDESLGYSYEQRAEHHQRALNLALELERAGRELRGDINNILRRLCDADIVKKP